MIFILILAYLLEKVQEQTAMKTLVPEDSYRLVKGNAFFNVFISQ